MQDHQAGTGHRGTRWRWPPPWSGGRASLGAGALPASAAGRGSSHRARHLPVGFGPDSVALVPGRTLRANKMACR